MAQVQKYFEEFHGAIRLGRFDEESTLREKRDIIQRKLRDGLPDEFANHEEDAPAFRFADQGSYALGTGIKPIAGDFDIDQGVYFELTDGQYSDGVVLKQRIRDALEGHTKKVLIRRSCVTVFYQRAGEDQYHVDLAVYRDGAFGALPRIAKGKEFSEDANRTWELSDPAGLSNWFTGTLNDTERAQLRRLVRCMKRWKDENFAAEGNAAPTGIALTVAVRSSFAAQYIDSLAGKVDDLRTLKSAVEAVVSSFVLHIESNGTQYHRARIQLPVQPCNDLLEKLTNVQSQQLYEKLVQLKDALTDAERLVDPVDACKKLRAVFGKDFPVPDPTDTAAKAAPAILGSSASA